jgi:membrane-bound lytic murein transglycosylase B
MAFLLVSGCVLGNKQPVVEKPVIKKQVVKKPDVFSSREDVQQFIARMNKQHKFDKAKLISLFNKIKTQQSVLEKISNPFEDRPWYFYKQHFLGWKRIHDGAKFWQEHKVDLTRAEKLFGVPASIIVAIIGVESDYGQELGSYRVLDSLATLAFNYPPRAQFFTKELREFLILCRANRINPSLMYGSYAGAFGQAQFMPSSFRHYAVDFSKSGTINLRTDERDVIGSIGNYLKLNGWKRGKIIAVRAYMRKYYWPLPENSTKANYTIAQVAKYNILPAKFIPPNSKVGFLALDAKGKKEYWLGLHNLYVITRYNTSINYAMVVYELAQAIREEYYAERK